MTSGLLVQVTTPDDIVAVQEQMGRYLGVQTTANPEWPIQSFAFDNLAEPASDAYTVRGGIRETARPRP
jgi:hypothetical protein